MRVLISGGSGYLAGRLADSLLKRGHKVKLASRSSMGTQRLKLEGAIYIKVDYEDIDSLMELARDQDVVIHAAGLDAESSAAAPDLAFTVNTHLTEQFARASKAAGVKTFIYLSTIHVYSEDLDGEYKESSPLLNLHPYAASHAAGEKRASEIASESFYVVNLRLANIFGAPIFGFGKSAKLVMHDFVIQALRTGKIVVSSPSSTERNFVPARYLSELVIRLVEDSEHKRPNQTINIVSERNMTLHDLAIEIATRTQAVRGAVPVEVLTLPLPPLGKNFQISNSIANGIFKYDSEYFSSELDNLIKYVNREMKNSAEF